MVGTGRWKGTQLASEGGGKTLGRAGRQTGFTNFPDRPNSTFKLPSRGIRCWFWELQTKLAILFSSWRVKMEWEDDCYCFGEEEEEEEKGGVGEKIINNKIREGTKK